MREYFFDEAVSLRDRQGTRFAKWKQEVLLIRFWESKNDFLLIVCFICLEYLVLVEPLMGLQYMLIQLNGSEYIASQDVLHLFIILFHYHFKKSIELSFSGIVNFIHRKK